MKTSVLSQKHFSICGPASTSSGDEHGVGQGMNSVTPAENVSFKKSSKFEQKNCNL